jgi:hypothetical protein
MNECLLPGAALLIVRKLNVFHFDSDASSCFDCALYWLLPYFRLTLVVHQRLCAITKEEI